VDTELVVARLETRFTPEEAAIAELLLHDLSGCIQHAQLIEEIGLAIAIHRRHQRPLT
jgi:hypothetical protein